MLPYATFTRPYGAVCWHCLRIRSARDIFYRDRKVHRYQTSSLFLQASQAMRIAGVSRLVKTWPPREISWAQCTLFSISAHFKLVRTMSCTVPTSGSSTRSWFNKIEGIHQNVLSGHNSFEVGSSLPLPPYDDILVRHHEGPQVVFNILSRQILERPSEYRHVL